MGTNVILWSSVFATAFMSSGSFNNHVETEGLRGQKKRVGTLQRVCLALPPSLSVSVLLYEAVRSCSPFVLLDYELVLSRDVPQGAVTVTAMKAARDTC